MADDFYTRISTTLNSIPTPQGVRLLEPIPRSGFHADFLWRIFKTTSPTLDDIRCAKQALRRCLQGADGLGWLIWDQVAEWRPPAPMLAGDMRHVVKAHPPWEIRDSAEQRRLINRSRNQARDMTVDQRLVATMQSRIRQWLSKCYGTPLRVPRWEELIRHTNANKAARLNIMEKAVAGRLIPELTPAMLDTLNRTNEDMQQQTQEQREHQQRRRAKRAQRLQRKREAAWKQHRRQSRGIEE